MLKLKVNDKEIEVEEGLTVLQACEQAGYEIPRFCYHGMLSKLTQRWLRKLEKV